MTYPIEYAWFFTSHAESRSIFREFALSRISDEKKKTFNLRVERGKNIFWIMVTLGVLFFHNSAYSCDFFLFSRELSLQQYNTRETDTDNYNIHLKRLFTSELLFYIVDKKTSSRCILFSSAADGVNLVNRIL